MPSPRRAHESVLVQDKLLVWGGRQSGQWEPLSRCELHKLDLLSWKWSSLVAKTPTNQDCPPPCGQARCAVINNTVYSFGGYYINIGEKSLCRVGEIFAMDCEKMTWRKLDTSGQKPVARDSHGLCAVDGKLVMFGGAISHADSDRLPAGTQYKPRIPVTVSKYGYTNDCWEFCPNEISWTPLQTFGSSPCPRGAHTLTTASPVRIVLYGGWNPTYLSDMHLLECRYGMWKWVRVEPSGIWPGGRIFHTTCCVSPRRCIIIGGWVDGCPDGNAHVVDIETGIAHQIILDDSRASHTACCQVASDGSAHIFVFGGTKEKYSNNSLSLVVDDFRVYTWDNSMLWSSPKLCTLNTQLAARNEGLTELSQLRRKLSKSEVEIETLRLEKKAARQVIKGSRHLHQLCKCIESHESSQLIEESRQLRHLENTCLDGFQINSILGQSATSQTRRYGCFSLVYDVKGRHDSKSYALKAIIIPRDDAGCKPTERDIERQFNSEYILPCQPHPNILRVFHHFCQEVQPGDLPAWPKRKFGSPIAMFLVMKKYEYNLEQYSQELHEKGLMNENALLPILLQLLKAVEHLIKHNILHCNLKLSNAFVEKLDKSMIRVVVGDFGCIYGSTGSLERANSQQLQQTGGGYPIHDIDSSTICDVNKADVWSVGLMAYEMVTGRKRGEILPYDMKQRPYTADMLPALPGNYSFYSQQLLQQLVTNSPAESLTAAEGILLCCVLLYGPPIPVEGTMSVGSAERWLDEQVMSLRGKTDHDLLCDPLYVQYLALFLPCKVTGLVNKFIVG